MGCIFCGIVEGSIPSHSVYQDEQIVAFRDVAPMAALHVLVIPRKHISGIDALTPEDGALLGHIWTTIPKIAASLGLEKGYRVVCNNGADAGQTVAHIHFHILGGESLGGFGAK